MEKIEKAEAGAALENGDTAPFELKIAEALEAVGLRVCKVRTARYGHSGFLSPTYTIIADIPRKEAT